MGLAESWNLTRLEGRKQGQAQRWHWGVRYNKERVAVFTVGEKWPCSWVSSLIGEAWFCLQGPHGTMRSSSSSLRGEGIQHQRGLAECGWEEILEEIGGSFRCDGDPHPTPSLLASPGAIFSWSHFGRLPWGSETHLWWPAWSPPSQECPVGHSPSSVRTGAV